MSRRVAGDGHGSTRWLWRDEDVKSAMEYVVEEQGEAMEVFCRGEWYPLTHVRGSERN